MTNNHDRFEEFRAENLARSEETLHRFMERNDQDQLLRDGFLVEYEQEYDHLYITFGERREGMALVMWPIVFIADPDTLECLGVEIVDFRASVAAGLAKGWEGILPLVTMQPILRMPPVPRAGVDFSLKLEDAMRQQLARV